MSSGGIQNDFTLCVASARRNIFMRSGVFGALSDPAVRRWQERVIRARKWAPLRTFITAFVHCGAPLFPPVFAPVCCVHMHTNHLKLSSLNSSNCDTCNQLLASTLIHPGHTAVFYQALMTSGASELRNKMVQKMDRWI